MKKKEMKEEEKGYKKAAESAKVEEQVKRMRYERNKEFFLKFV